MLVFLYRATGFDCGNGVQRWLTDYLADDSYRLLKYNQRLSDSYSTTAANSAPFLLICTASIQKLILNIPTPFVFTTDEIIERMRPNLVLQTLIPFEEDYWQRISIGGVELIVVDKCARCQMVSVSPTDGLRTQEPLRTLIRLRGMKVG